jgi:hypothetical protein
LSKRTSLRREVSDFGPTAATRPQTESSDPPNLRGPSGKTRVSVINLAGLASEDARDSFVNPLQMSLFTFIKRNPNPTGCLYVIDEAQNFAPSGAGTACKASAWNGASAASRSLSELA